LTEEVERAFLDRYRRLPAAAQTLLLIAAAGHSGRTATLTRAATGLGAGAVTLDVAAIKVGLPLAFVGLDRFV
jgi:hypothetical protein